MSVKRIDCCVKVEPCVKSFPKLMRCKTSGAIAIVALTGGYYTPTVLVRGGLTEIGHKSITKREERDINQSWEDYNEPLTLQNE